MNNFCINFQLKTLEQEKDEIINDNRRIAESNLEQEPKLIELRANINELTTEGKELSQKVQEKLSTLSKLHFIECVMKANSSNFHFFRIKKLKCQS